MGEHVTFRGRIHCAEALGVGPAPVFRTSNGCGVQHARPPAESTEFGLGSRSLMADLMKRGEYAGPECRFGQWPFVVGVWDGTEPFRRS